MVLRVGGVGGDILFYHARIGGISGTMPITIFQVIKPSIILSQPVGEVNGGPELSSDGSGSG